MRCIALLVALALTASGCTMILENQSLKAENEALRKEAAAEKIRAERVQRELEYARRHPEALGTPAPARAARPAAPGKASAPAAPARPASAKPAPGKAPGQARLVIGETDVAAEGRAAARQEVVRLNTLIAAVQADYELLGSDSDKYTDAFNDLLAAIERSGAALAQFDEVVLPALAALPPPPSEAAQGRYDAAVAELAQREEAVRLRQQEAADQLEAEEAARAQMEAIAKAAAQAVAEAEALKPPPPPTPTPFPIPTPAGYQPIPTPAPAPTPAPRLGM